MAKFRGVIAALLAGSLAVLAGCGGTSGGTGSKAGASDNGSSKAKSVKIGVLIPQSGSMAALGKTMKAGYTLAAEQINAAGGIKGLGGAQVELAFGDTQSQANAGAAEAERLVQREQVPVLVGEYASATSLVISDAAERLNVPFLVPISVADKITDRGYKNTFRINAPAAQWNEDHVRFITELDSLIGKKVTAIGIIYEDSDWGQDTIKGFEKLLPKEIKVTKVGYTKGVTDLTTQVAKLKDANPDVLVPVCYIQEAIILAETSARLNFKPLVVANGGGFLETDYLKLGKIVEGVISLNHWTPDFSDATAKLNETFRAKNGVDMNGNSALAYQSIRLLAAVLEQAGAATPDAIRKGLVAADLKPGPDMIMPYQSIKFDATGQNKSQLLMAQVQDGKYVSIWPKGFGKFPLKKPN